MGLCARRRLREEGEPHPDGEAGDLRFRLRQEPHPRFRREDDDLHFDLPITLTEALVGFSKAIRHLDGHWVEVTESGERAGCRGTPLSSRAAAATSSAARHGQASRRAATPTSGRFTACRDLDFRVPPEQGHNKPGTRSVRGFRGRGRVPRVQSRHRPGTLLWRFQRSSGASRPAHALARGFEY